MADLSKITVNGVTYTFADEKARQDILNVLNQLTGAMRYIGTCIDEANITSDGIYTHVYIKTGAAGSTTAICYYHGTKPTATTYVFGGVTYTLTYKEVKAGDVAISGRLEYVFSDADNLWHEFGDTGSLKALAFKDKASGKFKPKGSVSSTFSGTPQTVKHTVTNSGSVSASGSFTPSGTVTQGKAATDSFVKSYPGSTSKMVQTTIHDTPTPQKKTIPIHNYIDGLSELGAKLVKKQITGVSGSTKASKANATSVPGMSASVSGDTLILTTKTVSFSDVTVPVAGSAESVATGDVSETGTGARVLTGVSGNKMPGLASTTDIEVVTDITAGAEVIVATGEVNTSATGDSVMVGMGTPTKGNAVTSVGNPTFKGTAGNVSVSGTNTGVVIADHTITPAGSVSSSFSGTEETVTVR